MKVFVCDPNAAYRRRLAASLTLLEGVEEVAEAPTVAQASEHPAIREADLVLLDPALDGASELIAALSGSGRAQVIASVSGWAQDAVLPSVAVAPAARGDSRLTEREQRVLALIAAGHATREVAEQLCYSERTVKSVVHDVVTKLNARSRSQAVAHAVREGLI